MDGADGGRRRFVRREGRRDFDVVVVVMVESTGGGRIEEDEVGRDGGTVRI